MADPTDFLDLDSPQKVKAEAARRFGIPQWVADYFMIELMLERPSESVVFPPELREVVIEKSFVRLRGRCYRIEDFGVFDYLARYETGTAVYKLRVQQPRTMVAILQAEKLKAELSGDAANDLLNPIGGMIGSVADFIARLAKTFKEIPVVEVFGDIADALDALQLLDALTMIRDRAIDLKIALEDLQWLDGTVIRRVRKVRQLVSLERMLRSSKRLLIEIECTGDLLKLKEGEAVRAPEQDEKLFPGPKLKLKGRGPGEGDRRARRPMRGPEVLPGAALRTIQALRIPAAVAKGGGEVKG